VLDSALPRSLPPTIYARVGDVPAALIVGIALILALRRRRHPAMHDSRMATGSDVPARRGDIPQ